MSSIFCVRSLAFHIFLAHELLCICFPSHSSVFSLSCLYLFLSSLLFLLRFRFLSYCLSLCHLAVSNQTGRLSVFMTADMWQFPFVNDKKCANYLSGCFTANQTLTSCVCVCVSMCASLCISVCMFESVGMRESWTRAVWEEVFCRILII